MPAPWVNGDNVQVRVGVGVWCNAVVDTVLAPGKYCCTITDDPLPSLADCGKTHPHVPDTTLINPLVCAYSTANTITGIEDSIRDPI